MSADDEWKLNFVAHESGGVLTNWEGGLAATILASALSYWFQSKWADFMLRDLTPSAVERALLAACFVVFVVLDFVAVAILPLTMVVPITMLMFAWGSLYQLRAALDKRRYLLSPSFMYVLAIIALVGVAVRFSPKGLYVVYIPKIVLWDSKCVAYTAFFSFTACALHVLRWRPKLAMRLFRWTGVSDRDMRTIVRSVLVGLLGGQALVLLKLVAEIIENSIFHHELLFEGTATGVVVVCSVAASSLHIYSLHSLLATLDQANVRLSVPVHRISFILSATIGAAVYLEEWAGPETTNVELMAYALSLATLLAICARFANKATVWRSPQVVRSDVEMQAQQEPEGQLPCSPSSPSRSTSRSTSPPPSSSPFSSQRPPTPVRLCSSPQTASSDEPQLWDLGIGPAEVYEEDSFFMSSTRSFIGLATRVLQGAPATPAPGGPSSPEPVPAITNTPTLNTSYPQLRNTLCVPRGVHNPHTESDSVSSWKEVGQDGGVFKVRGPGYLDRKSAGKVDPGASRMQLVAMQWSYAPTPVQSVSLEEDGFVRSTHSGRADRPFMLILNHMIPTQGNFVMYMVPRADLVREDESFRAVLDRFVNSDSDEYRNERLKIVPGVVEGGLFVRKAVGSRPALICSKLNTTYHKSWPAGERVDVLGQGGHVLECTIDIGSSYVARSVMGAIKGYATGLCIRVAYVIEAKDREELPERILSGLDINRPTMAPRQGVSLKLDTVAEAPAEVSDDPHNAKERKALDQVIRPPASPTSPAFTEGSFRSVMDLDQEDDLDMFVDVESYHDPSELDHAYPAWPEGSTLKPRALLEAEREELEISNVVAAAATGYHYADYLAGNVPAEAGFARLPEMRSFWVDSGSAALGGWRVRGPTYQQDKVKVPCGLARMRVAAVDWHAESDKAATKNVAADPDGYVAKHHAGRSDRPFMLIINLVVPDVGQLCVYCTRAPDVEDDVFDAMLDAFVRAPDDAYRDARFKILPGILEGSHFVRKAVGAKPGLAGTMLTSSYFAGDNSFEVCLDVGSSAAGVQAFSAVKGFAGNLVLHLGFCLESKTRRELPERLLAGVDIHRPVVV